MHSTYLSVTQSLLPPQKNLFHFIWLSSIARSEILSLPSSIFRSGLSGFRLLFVHTKCTFRNRSRRCFDGTLAFHIDVFARCFDVVLKAQIWELKRWLMNLSPITVQLFGFFHWRVSIHFLVAQICIENIARIKRCHYLSILNPVCCLHFVPSLHFKPNLQATVSSQHFIWTVQRISCQIRVSSGRNQTCRFFRKNRSNSENKLQNLLNLTEISL